MTLQSQQAGFSAGEVSPSLFGRTDFAKYHQGMSTCRNAFVNYRGGAYSRAGLAFVGMCKQGAPNMGGTATSNPPRDIRFQFSITQGFALEFGDQYMRIKSNGAYVTETPLSVTSVNAGGIFTTSVSHGYSVGDWVYNLGNTGFNGLTWVITSVPTSTTFTVQDLFGTNIASATASGAGTIARIYTLTTPYAAIDLFYLKYTQSADLMSLCCVNTSTLTEYSQYDLKRFGATNWTLTQTSYASSISPPTNVAVTAQSSTTVSTWYSYLVTAVNGVTGEESVASATATVENNDIAIYAGSNTITWKGVTGAGSYNIYKSTPSYSVGVPVGVLYGFCGTAYGTSFVDTNITADFTKVAPTHQNPFARGSILSVNISAGGTLYTQATVGYSVTTSTGSGFAGTPIVVGGAVVAFIITNGGSGYVPADTIVITGSVGSGALAALNVGPQTGTYPGTVAYYQQRRVYASSLNNPDTYWMSQPGAFTNMDASTPVSDGDAITGTPWSQQINGVQWLVPMPGGLVVLTGKGAWQLTGQNNGPITPSTQTATPQAYNGCNNIVEPIVVNYDILYLQAKGSIFRDLSYNFFVNIYTGTDLTVLSNHLFSNYTFSQWAWSEEPYKLAWAVRNDGVLLSLTYLKEQEVFAWTRHDTDGLFVSVTTVTEPPVDAVYVIVKRYIRGNWVYYAERMDNRAWTSAENCFCVDAGLKYPLTYPAATLTPAASYGTNNIISTLMINGGKNYTAPSAIAVDPTGAGNGATFECVVNAGVITSISVLTEGINYAQGTQLVISDSTGSGAIYQPIITNNVTFNASSSVFNSGMVGNVIRVGGGNATITSYVSGTQVVANITQSISNTLNDDPLSQPVPAIAGTWSLSVPTKTVSGLNHLEGKSVAILADGSVFTNQTVVNGTITLPTQASYIVVGLPFTVQIQTLYLDPINQPVTIQNKRKNIYSVGVRLESSRGLFVGCNQIDASTQPGLANQTWGESTGMVEVKERNANTNAGSAIPLITGDVFVNIPGKWDTRGQIALMTNYPLPLNILSVVAYYESGDTPAP